MNLAEANIASRMGWRNLWRNPQRSAITALAIAAAFVILIVLSGLLGGIRHQLLANGTELMLGHLQLHHTEYIADRHVSDTIPTDDLPRLLAALTDLDDVQSAAPRVRAYGLVSSGDASAGGRLIGVDPQREASVTTLLDETTGEATLPESGSQSIMLGDALAREIGASIGDEIAVVAQAADGSLGNALFTVTGLMRTGLRNLDRTIAIAHIADLQAMLALGAHDVHEIALLAGDPFAAEHIAARLNAGGQLPADTRAREWGELSPQLRDYISVNEGFGGFLILIVAAFAAFGVMNSMLMAVFERTREFGTLHAIGTQRTLILASLLMEALLLALIGLALGLVLGAVVMHDLIGSGWDLTRWTGELSLLDTRLDPVLYGTWDVPGVLQAGVGLLLATLAASLLAAGRILRLDPIAAMSAPTEA
ncbi:MAG: ABC transporter permease [Gammaproteobacteria bacterium]|nr:ABC transporter permease [Gammaproteobacteria bacterium]